MAPSGSKTGPRSWFANRHGGVVFLIDDNPIKDPLLLADKDSIPLIMKDGKIYKYTLREN